MFSEPPAAEPATFIATGDAATAAQRAVAEPAGALGGPAEAAPLPRAFSPHEHERFVAALNAAPADTDDAALWHTVGAHTGRSPEDVAAHALYYLMSLQSRHADVARAALGGSAAWTVAENAVFERGLAEYDEGDADRWRKIAALLPGKSPQDVQRWYERLVGDLLDIERGAVRTASSS
mmetsp:Transcript_2740/g.10460  ORF Transcript_2740/g.10460 Transcript_2740/m.10460 type:complete len:179 (+) Transcript_2740:234-770(+)